MKELKNYTDQELIEEYQSLTSCIEDTYCFGTKDLIEQNLIALELERRGYEATQRTIIDWVKKNEE
jgi:hypothetical protein